MTKKSIFSGVLVDKRSEVKHINGKKQNVEVTAFVKEKEGFVKVLLKFQVIYLVNKVLKRRRWRKAVRKASRIVVGQGGSACCRGREREEIMNESFS